MSSSPEDSTSGVSQRVEDWRAGSRRPIVLFGHVVRCLDVYSPPQVLQINGRPCTAMRNCRRDEGGPFELGNQLLIPSHRELLRPKAMVVSVAEAPGQ
jgi:hypothetical protein